MPTTIATAPATLKQILRGEHEQAMLDVVIAAFLQLTRRARRSGIDVIHGGQRAQPSTCTISTETLNLQTSDLRLAFIPREGFIYPSW
jgi:hypothetical protein